MTPEHEIEFAPGVDRIVPPPYEPMAVARQFVAENYTSTGGLPLLHHHRNTFYSWVGDHYPEDDERRIQSELWHWLEHSLFWSAKDELVPFRPTRHKIANILEALRAIGHIAQAIQPPAWIDGDHATPIDPGQVVPLNNGILEFSTRELRPHTPELFSQHILPFAYDPNASTPAGWLRFLDELWGEDGESKATLAEWFGYVLSNDTSYQKAFLLVGPKRSGKGTIARVLTGLLGAHNVAAPTLASLAQNFGLQPLVGRPLALISDARLGSRSDNTIAVERLLSISGEDALTVDRKYREPWTGRLPTRFMILTNELPRFSDSSGALASRFVMLTLTTSFYDRENPQLTDELLEEAAGIFNWALEGLDRLRSRGHFVVPTTARDAQRHLEDLSSPVSAFVRDRCSVGDQFRVTKDDLWAAWKEWCQDEGAHHGTKAVFLRNLRSALPTLTPLRLRAGEQRTQALRGIKLVSQPSESLTIPDLDPNDQRSENGQVSLAGQGWSGVAATVERTDSTECIVCGAAYTADEEYPLRCPGCSGVVAI